MVLFNHSCVIVTNDKVRAILYYSPNVTGFETHVPTYTSSIFNSISVH